MKIGLYNLEPKIVNTAMMQVSTYEKERGNGIEMYSPLYHNTYDKIYAFSLIKVMDNNFFANPKWRESIDQLLEWKQKVDLQGFDIRIFNEEQGDALTELKHYNAFKFAWDNPRDNIDDKIELLLNYIKPYKLMCYVLIGYWSTPQEDYERVMHLWNKYKIHSFVMPYDKFDPYQKSFYYTSTAY